MSTTASAPTSVQPTSNSSTDGSSNPDEWTSKPSSPDPRHHLKQQRKYLHACVENVFSRASEFLLAHDQSPVPYFTSGQHHKQLHHSLQNFDSTTEAMLIFIEKLKYELEQKREQSGIEPQTEQFNDEIQADSSNVNSNVQMDTNT